MSKNNVKKNSRQNKSQQIITNLIVIAVSCLVLFLSFHFIYPDLLSYRPCSVNDAGVAAVSCGKSSLTGIDVIFISFFVGSLIVAVSKVYSTWKLVYKKT